MLDIETFGIDASSPPGTYRCVFSQSPSPTNLTTGQTAGQTAPFAPGVSIAVEGVVVAHDALQCTTPVCWPCILHLAPCTLHPAPCTRHPRH